MLGLLSINLQCLECSFLFLSPVQIFQGGNVPNCQYSLSTTINFRPQHLHRNMLAIPVCHGFLATSSFLASLFSLPFSFSCTLSFTISLLKRPNTVYPRQNSLCRGLVESFLLMNCSSDLVPFYLLSFTLTTRTFYKKNTAVLFWKISPTTRQPWQKKKRNYSSEIKNLHHNYNTAQYNVY